ncbi:MAG TPA: apolipoprotein N-acyltransferase [Streptosporangiaceae bacterium]|nr:apolipoprotein N-acyltransferase [Streptosporangiaceae bacterium]
MSSPRRRAYALRAAALAAGALPVLSFPRVGLDWFAWVALVPGLLIIRAAPDARAGAVRGWWFGAGYLIAALYWTVPNIGPGLLLIAVVFGALWAGWGLAAWLLRDRAAAAPVVLPSIWLVIEYIRSWHALGGPWALLGATQWRHPVVLSLAALGGVWLVSFAIVAVNTALAGALAGFRAAGVAAPARWAPPLAVPLVVGLAAPAAYGLRSEPPRPPRPFTVALVQPGVVHSPAARFVAGEQITRALPPVDLIVWGESSVGFDISRRTDLSARLTALAARGELLANEDAQDVSGRISKSSILFGPDGERGRYVKTRLVPFGEYIPFRSALGWLTKISEAAGQNRVPGTGVRVLTADGGLTFGPLVCFESAFPDLGRAVVRHGARVLVYQSATSTFQDSWAPAQHAALGALRAAETGRPVVQAALTGVSAAYDARGRRLAWMGTSRRGSVLVTLWPAVADGSTPFVRYGDLVPYFGIAVTAIAVAAFAAGAARRSRAGTNGTGAMGGTSGGLGRTWPNAGTRAGQGAAARARRDITAGPTLVPVVRMGHNKGRGVPRERKRP